MAGLAGDGERLVQEVVEQLAVLVALAELRGLGAQLLVAEAGDVRLEVGDPLGLVLERLEAPAFTGVQQLVDDLDHWDIDSRDRVAGFSTHCRTACEVRRTGAPGRGDGRRARGTPSLRVS